MEQHQEPSEVPIYRVKIISKELTPSCCKCCDVNAIIFNCITWIFFILIIYYYIAEKYNKDGNNGTYYIFTIFWAISYFIYLISEFCSTTFSYLRKKMIK